MNFTRSRDRRKFFEELNSARGERETSRYREPRYILTFLNPLLKLHACATAEYRSLFHRSRSFEQNMTVLHCCAKKNEIEKEIGRARRIPSGIN